MWWQATVAGAIRTLTSLGCLRAVALPRVRISIAGLSFALGIRFECHCECPLLGVKRTSPSALHMSAFDPKRTSVSKRLEREKREAPPKRGDVE